MITGYATAPAVPPNEAARPVVITRDMNGSRNDSDSVLVRTGDEPRTGDHAVDDAHENAQVALDFFQQVLGRNSIDGNGSAVTNYVHDQSDPMNAFWDNGVMRYGDGDGTNFKPMSSALDIVAHEMSHGVIQAMGGLVYHGQSGALNESYADVFGEIAQQWHEDRARFGTADAARGADWLLGEDAMLPEFGRALRDMAHPGTAYENDWAGTDPQVGTMDHYVQTPRDYGGVHINSGIPNRAAYEAALQIGSEKVAKIWYDALGSLKPSATFSEAARAIVGSAEKLYGSSVSGAVADAWKAVEVLT